MCFQYFICEYSIYTLKEVEMLEEIDGILIFLLMFIIIGFLNADVDNSNTNIISDLRM